MSVESRPNKLTKGLVLDTFHTDVDNTVATYALNSQLEDQEGNHFHYGSEVGTTYIKDIPANHVVIGHINMERNETVLFTTDGTNSTIGILSRNDDMSYNYEIKVDDSKQEKKLGFKKEGYVRGVYRLLNGCDKVIYFVDGINKDRRININQLDSYKLPTTASVASGIIFDDSLRATIYALSSATGNIQLIRLLSASPEATANVLANLSSGAELTKLLTASANGMGTAFANLIRTANIVSSIEATGTSTVNVDIVRLLESNVSAIGSVNAILQSSQQGIVEIDVTLTGVASSTAILLRSALLEVNLTTEASTVTTAILTRIISAQSQALADTSATAQITIPVNATANATATTAADAILSYAVNATANAIANTEATSQLSKVITASVDAVANSSSEALIGLVLVSTTTANGSVSTADLYINRLLTSSVTAQGTTTAEALIAKLLQSSVTSTATATSDALVSKLATSSITAQAITTADSLISKLLTSTVNSTGNVTANLQLADLLSTALSGTATTEAVLEAINLLIGDPYIDNVSLLLQGDDNPSGVTQNNTFKDSSTNNFTITPNGNVTQGTFSPFDRALTNSGGSAYFDGTGDYLSTTANNTLVFGTSPYTVETWVYQTARPNVQWIIGGNSGFQLGINSSGFIFGDIAGVGSMTAATTAIVLNTWTHVAIIRNTTSAGGVTYYINGTASGTATDSTNYTFVPTLNIGTTNGNLGVNPFTGYLSNLRVVKGTAVYTSNFQPSTIPLTAITNTSLLLNFTNAAIFDGVKLNNIETVGNAQISTAQSKFGGSLSFSGTSYLNAGNQSTLDLLSNNFTVEFWLYKNATTAYMTVCGDFLVASTNTWQILFDVNGTKIAWFDGASNTFTLTSTNVVSNTTWTHIAFVRSGTTLTVYLNGVSNGSASLSTNYSATTNFFVGHTPELLAGRYLNGYIDDLRITKGIARYTSNFTSPSSKLSSIIPNYLVSRSLRFNSADLTYLNRTPSVAGNRTTFTWSAWVKRGSLGTYQALLSAGTSGSADRAEFAFSGSGDTLQFGVNISSTWYELTTTQVFRDPSAWYHFVWAVDTTQTTSSNRSKLYINGVQVTAFSATSYPAQNATTSFNDNTKQMSIGYYSPSSTGYFDGYITEVNWIDGQALTPDSFGIRNTSTGVWSPKEYTGTYGTNGFHLNFSDITQLGKDFSGNNNNWTPSGFSVTPGVGYDSLTDVPTPNGTDNGFGGEVRGNYCTWNPLYTNSVGVGSLSNGLLEFSVPNTYVSTADMAMTSGKWYWEVTPTTNALLIGIKQVNITDRYGNTIYYGGASITSGGIYVNGNPGANFANWTVGDVIGVAPDMDAGVVNFYKNGVLQGNVALSSAGITVPVPAVGSGAGLTFAGVANFGQRPFAYQAPTGFKALNTANLPTPAIGGGGESNLANKYMDITTYTGTGAAQSIFNSGFKPDFVWIKSRSGTTGHAIYDINRGVNKQLASNSDALEITNTSGLTSFDNTGFSIGTLGDINTNGATYVAWQWRAGGTPLTTAAGNTISSSVSINSLSKFSITTYTGNGIAGATIAHALGVIPRMVIIKSITGAVSNWAVYHGSLGNTSSLFLNTNGVSLTSNTYWNNTNPTANLISLGTSDLVNANTRNYVAYAWAEIDGYSKFSSYLGNNSTDGTFVYTGFKPKYILIKCSTVAANWVLYNSIVNAGNPVVNELFANTTNAENGTTSDEIDFLSNGFKLRSINAAINAAQTYIYAAFAETPFKYATAALTPEVKETVTVDYLVVAGGGGGANPSVSGSATKGTNSSISTIIISNGGGGGGRNDAGTSGGSGGGAASAAASAALGTNGQGFNGGTMLSSGAGGGGGAGGLGGNAPSNNDAGNGGLGLQSTIKGITPTPYYAGGGGGGKFGTGTNGIGGSGVGGSGGSPGGNGSANTGSGGGGGSSSATNNGGGGGGAGGLRSSVSGDTSGGNSSAESSLILTKGTSYTITVGGGGTTSVSGAGGSGIVIIRATIQAASTTGSPSYTTSGSYHIYEFNGDGSIKY